MSLRVKLLDNLAQESLHAAVKDNVAPESAEPTMTVKGASESRRETSENRRRDSAYVFRNVLPSCGAACCAGLERGQKQGGKAVLIGNTVVNRSAAPGMKRKR